ncbi:RNA-directed DNA polymerase from mobile element jockey, partial [Elysia marginata]
NGVSSGPRAHRTGLPQGSALSCTLFLCYINDLREAVLTTSKLAFADDIVLWQQNTDVEKAAENLNRDLDALKHYCERWRMVLKAQKTVYTTFSNSNDALGKELNIQ